MSDDIVVVEGTPLASHLLDVGLGDDIECKEEASNVHRQTIWRSVFNSILETLGSPKESVIRDCYQNLAVNAIIKADILDEMDIGLIFTERGFQPSMSEEMLRWILIKRAVKDAIIALAPSLIMTVWVKKGLLAKAIILSPVAAFLLSWVPVFSAQKEYKKLLNFLESSKKFGLQIRLASRLINENALINRGFMLSKNNSIAVWQLETNSLLTLMQLSEKSLPGLRIAVVDSVSRLAKSYSEELEIQRVLKPLGFWLDHEVHCLPPVEAFNMSAGESPEAVPELHVIKKAIDVAMVKEREFVRRLMFQLLTEQRGTFSVQVGPKLLQSLKEGIEVMEIAVLLNKCLFTHNRECHLKSIKSEEYPHGMLYSVCHSARLHLEGALREAHCIENAFEVTGVEHSVLKVFLSFPLSRMQFHMDSANECLNRASIMVDKSASKMSSNGAKMAKTGNENQGRSEVEDCNALMAENLPKDEIFELIGEKGGCDVDDEEEEESACVGGTSLLRESSEQMMKELKSVLRVKAQDWQEREMRLRGVVPTESHDDALSTSSSVAEGDVTSTSMNSWVMPSLVEPGNPSGLVATELEDGGRFDPKVLGSIATAAVAKARINQEMGYLNKCDEEYVISGEED
ncbi:uncharacterized protein LOC124171445 [Ischnura elegans]|uniref:uncharacterized protein LOC124171445 n=1 Tax=Ischnura elegans TaxID=197161 RepID=UPI001ED870FB|nr:uncharacterized protein LOC124171445 [Ischnura elegans]